MERLKPEASCHSERPMGAKNPAALRRRPFAALRVTYTRPLAKVACRSGLQPDNYLKTQSLAGCKPALRTLMQEVHCLFSKLGITRQARPKLRACVITARTHGAG